MTKSQPQSGKFETSLKFPPVLSLQTSAMQLTAFVGVNRPGECCVAESSEGLVGDGRRPDAGTVFETPLEF